jgi:hypothetical protein
MAINAWGMNVFRQVCQAFPKEPASEQEAQSAAMQTVVDPTSSARAGVRAWVWRARLPKFESSMQADMARLCSESNRIAEAPTNAELEIRAGCGEQTT